MSAGTPARNIRIDDRIWAPAKARAARDYGRGGVSEVVRSLLESWLNGTVDALSESAAAHVAAVARIRLAAVDPALTEFERLEAVRRELAALDDDLVAVAAAIAKDKAAADEVRKAAGT